ncbi:hypothetical protein U9M48_036867 [Paspalum notatum var. saurae]|uniref:Uncharacterized protein n=1 Tax=Paspalum notatum var. saurae TaxID=547442 RepID=A0AAQ3X8P3_PASNO
MRVGGRIGRLDKTRLPTPTPPSPPPQEWEDLNDTEEEDPEKLVPDSSMRNDRKSSKCSRKCHLAFRKTKPRLKVKTEDKPNNNKTRMKIAGTRASTVGSTTHCRFLGCCGKR